MSGFVLFATPEPQPKGYKGNVGEVRLHPKMNSSGKDRQFRCLKDPEAADNTVVPEPATLGGTHPVEGHPAEKFPF